MIVELACEEWRCGIAPGIGGSIAYLTRFGGDVLRPAAGSDILAMASFPLVPFANRIGHGRLQLAGEVVQLHPDPAADPHAHHGHGWRRSWTVRERSHDHLLMCYEHEAGGQGWPWSYAVVQHLRLTHSGVHIELRVTNRDATRSMPAGCGIHPYLIRHPDSALSAEAEGIWLNGQDNLPGSFLHDTPFRAGIAVPIEAVAGFDNFFASSSPVAIAGRVQLQISGQQMAGFHLYAPHGESYFCVEPVSHAPNSFARGDYAPADLLAPRSTRSWHFSIGV